MGELHGACQMCNHRKADRLLEELGWNLTVAAVPRGAHWRLIGAQFDGDPPGKPTSVPTAA